jgi:hypothetical protein
MLATILLSIAVLVLGVVVARPWGLIAAGLAILALLAQVAGFHF